MTLDVIDGCPIDSRCLLSTNVMQHDLVISSEGGTGTTTQRCRSRWHGSIAGAGGGAADPR